MTGILIPELDYALGWPETITLANIKGLLMRVGTEDQEWDSF